MEAVIVSPCNVLSIPVVGLSYLFIMLNGLSHLQAVMEDRGFTLRRILRNNSEYCKKIMNECIIDGWALVHIAVALQNHIALRALVNDYGAGEKLDTYFSDVC